MKKEGFKEKLAQYALFAGPGMIIFLLVVAIPIFYGVYLTFTDWDGIARVKNFIGFENYVALFEDTEFWHSLYLTIKYVFISSPSVKEQRVYKNSVWALYRSAMSLRYRIYIKSSGPIKI